MSRCRLFMEGPCCRIGVLAVLFALKVYAGPGVSHLVTDTPGVSSAPENLLVVGESLFFAADDGIHGKELWRLNGDGEARLVGDFCPGPEGSRPRNLVALENRVCFVGLRLDYSRNKVLEFVWSVERTVADAVCHWYNREDESVEGDISLVVLGNELYGARTLGAFGRELVNFHRGFMVDTVPGAIGGVRKEQEYFAVLDDRLVFTVQPATLSSRILWAHRFDEAEHGAHGLADADAGAAGIGFPLYCVAVNERIWFSGSLGESGSELCMTDGTAAGTVFVKDINPGSGESMPKDFAGHQGLVYFQANDGVHGIELWRSDGTEDGTWLVKDINPGPSNSSPYAMRSIGSYLLFAATREDVGTELWRTDGTAEGTELVMDIYPGAMSSYLYQPTPCQGILLFAADHPNYGEELWRSDGTAEGTRLVKDIHTGPGHSEPYYLTVFQNHAYFCANDGIHGEEVWRSDGTNEGTVLVADIRPQTRIVRSSNPTNLTAASDGVYFAADDLNSGNELWWTDVDSCATRCVADIYPGPESSHPEELVLFDNTLFFTADDGVHGRALWRTDGADIIQVADLRKGPETSGVRLLRLSEQGLFFAASGDQGDAVYWMRDVKSAPVLVADLAALGVAGKITALRIYEEVVYICSRDQDGGVRFAGIQTDTMHAEVLPYLFSEAMSWERVIAQATATEMTDARGDALLQCYFSLPGMTGRFIRFRENWLFAARTAAHGVELWATEKETRGARLMLDCFPGPVSGSPGAFCMTGGELFFVAEHHSRGQGLWTTDGTTAGTYAVPLWTGQASHGMGPREGCEHGGALFFSAPGEREHADCRVLTKCERSPNGLMVVPAAESDRHWPDTPWELTSAGPWLYFSADHPALGRELWRYGTNKVGEKEYGYYTMVHNIGSEPWYDTEYEVHHYALHLSR